MISPASNPNHSDPLSWRVSVVSDGSPSASDGVAFTGNPNGDDNQNGLSNLVDFAVGGGKFPTASLDANGAFVFTVERDVTSQASLTIEVSGDLTNAGPEDWNVVRNPALSSREILSGNLERMTFSEPSTPGTPHKFIRTRFAVP